MGGKSGSSSGINTNGSSLNPNNFIFFDGGGLGGWDSRKGVADRVVQHPPLQSRALTMRLSMVPAGSALPLVWRGARLPAAGPLLLTRTHRPSCHHCSLSALLPAGPLHRRSLRPPDHPARRHHQESLPWELQGSMLWLLCPLQVSPGPVMGSKAFTDKCRSTPPCWAGEDRRPEPCKSSPGHLCSQGQRLRHARALRDLRGPAGAK